MAEAYLKDQRRILPCAAYCNGELGLKDIYVGVPTIIGAHGVEKIVDIKMTNQEKEMFEKSVTAVQGLVEACKGIDNSLAWIQLQLDSLGSRSKFDHWINY